MNESTLLRAYGLEPRAVRADSEPIKDPGHPYQTYDGIAPLAVLVVHVIDAHGVTLNPGAIDQDRLERLHAKLHGWVELGELSALDPLEARAVDGDR